MTPATIDESLTQRVLPAPSKVLLIAGFPPEGGGGGGVNLRSALSSFPQDRLFWLSLQADVTGTWQWRPEIQRAGVTRRVPGRRFKCVQVAWEQILHRFEAAQAVKIARTIKSEWRPDCVWAVLDHQALWAAYEVIQALGLPWHVCVQDDPAVSRLLIGSRLPAEWQKRFDYLYTGAQSRDCISKGMARYYEARYGAGAFVISRSINPVSQLEARKRTLFRGEAIEILMGGWGDCPAPWPGNLVEALRILQSRLARPVRLHAFDNALRPFEGDQVKVHSRLPDKEFEAMLNVMDLGYAPDPITGAAARIFTETSLPTKLVTYLAATLPCLYHGPANSTVGEMFGRYPAGEIVESQSPQDLADAFERLIRSADHYRDNALQLAACDFDPETLFERNLARF